ncbi:MAG: hypothetical protein FJ011_09860 [Chloroflexi bacterium]|nr:hypothetical protein [Chloroflexota bacterium]
MHTRLLTLLALLFLLGAGACRAPQPASTLGPRPALPPRTPTPAPASDEDAIRQLIIAEGQRVVSQDIVGLMELWAADAVIADARHTPDNPNDDARWRGRDAIRERYVVLVFPGNPAVVAPTDLRIAITGDAATVTSTTVIGSEVSPAGDRWTLARRDGRWWITGLTYNLEPKK